MSLVNDALRDLERRGMESALPDVAREGAPRAPLRAARRERGPRHLARIVLVAAALGASIAGGSVLSRGARRPPGPAADTRIAQDEVAFDSIAATSRSPVPARVRPTRTVAAPASRSHTTPIPTVPVAPRGAIPAERGEALVKAAPAKPAPGAALRPTRAGEDVGTLARRALAVADRDSAAGIPLLERVLRLDPFHGPARAALANALARAGRRAEAHAVLAEGAARAPEDLGLVRLEARLWVDEGREDEARARLEATLPATQDDPEHAAFLAALELRAGRHARAADLYRAALRAAPDRAAWWMGLGLALERGGRRHDARSAFEAALTTGGLEAEPARFVRDRLATLSPGDAQ